LLGDAYYGVSPELLRRNLDELLERATAIVSPRRVLVVRRVLFQPSLLARTDASTQQRWPLIFDEVGRQHGVEVLPFFLREVLHVPGMSQTDGIHPNVKGAAIVARTLWVDMRATANEDEAGCFAARRTFESARPSATSAAAILRQPTLVAAPPAPTRTA